MFLSVAIGLSTGLSTVAVVVAVLALRKSRQLTRWQSWPYEQIVAAESQLDEHGVQLAQHHERLRKINARLAARDRRANERTQPADTPDFVEQPAASASGQPARLPGESDLDWKRRMRAAIATGALKHG